MKNLQKDTVRLNFEFPKKQYPYLKMVCAQRGESLKDFATNLLIKAIEDAEDLYLAEKARSRLAAMDSEDLIPWNEATKLAGWEDENLQPAIRKKVPQKSRKNPAKVSTSHSKKSSKPKLRSAA